MSVSNSLRYDRLRRLHAQFLDASDSYPRLYHVCLRSNDPAIHSSLLDVVMCSVGSEAHVNSEFLWDTAIMWSNQQGNFSGEFLSLPCNLRIGAKDWIGRFIGWDEDNAEEDASRIRFMQLSENLLVEFQDWSPIPRFSDAPWLEMLYETLLCECEIVPLPSHLNMERSLPCGTVEVIGISLNVFLASARAIEILIDDKSTTSKPPQTPATPLPPTNNSLFIPTVLQQEILNALDGRALKKQALADKVCKGEGTVLYRKNVLPELRDRGLVEHKRGVGFYRPDAPPQGTIIPD